MSLHFSRGKNPEIFSFLAEELHNLKGRENAVRYRWALAADYLGTFYASSGAFTNAITAHKKALEIRPNDTFTWMNLGFAYKQTGDYPEAISSFRKAAGIKPYDPSIHFQLAELHNRTGNRRGAIQSLKNVLKYDPNNQNARLILRRLEGFKR
jgi:tetratricopeptide (TPR) repeat protein